MEVLPTRLEGPILLQPKIFRDQRGFFLETYRRSVLADLGIEDEFVQDNHSRSARGVVRGMHFQPGMAKLVRCTRGEIVDVLVDIRRGSPAFGEWEAFTLNDENLRQLYCPDGFAHGFCVTSEQASVLYKCTDFYSPKDERGIIWNDPALAISWPVAAPVLSPKDQAYGTLAAMEDLLPLYGSSTG